MTEPSKNREILPLADREPSNFNEIRGFCHDSGAAYGTDSLICNSGLQKAMDC